MNLILCILIVVLSTALGRLFAGRMSDRLAFYREYQLAYTQLTDRIVGINLELYKALKSCRGGRVEALLSGCADALKMSPQAAFSDTWRQSFLSLKGEYGYLTKDDLQIVMEGGGAIEALCANPSEKQAGLYLKRLSSFLTILENEKIKKCKLYNTAGVLSGLMIALLVI